MIKIYSSRFYEELKTFVWIGNKAQGMKGHNDDLVMSLAIGTWLYDASSDYSKDSKAVNSAMLSAFVSREAFDEIVENLSLQDQEEELSKFN